MTWCKFSGEGGIKNSALCLLKTDYRAATFVDLISDGVPFTTSIQTTIVLAKYVLDPIIHKKHRKEFQQLPVKHEENVAHKREKRTKASQNSENNKAKGDDFLMLLAAGNLRFS
jgi:hypothetical protein